MSIVDVAKSGDVTAESTQPTTENAAAVAVTTLRSSASSDITLAAVVGTESLLELFDVSMPSAPTALGTYRDPGREATSQLPTTASQGGRVRVRMQGSLAFFTDAYPPYLLRVVDLSDPAEPTLVTAYEAPGFIRDLAVSNDLVFLAVAAGPAGSSASSATRRSHSPSALVAHRPIGSICRASTSSLQIAMNRPGWHCQVDRALHECRKINLSTVFAGQRVGLRQVSDDIWLVSFMQYDLGYFDHETCRLEPINNPFSPKVLPMSPE